MRDGRRQPRAVSRHDDTRRTTTIDVTQPGQNNAEGCRHVDPRGNLHELNAEIDHTPHGNHATRPIIHFRVANLHLIPKLEK